MTFEEWVLSKEGDRAVFLLGINSGVSERLFRSAFDAGERSACNQWLPIETAHKDGTEIILLTRNYDVISGSFAGGCTRWFWVVVRVVRTFGRRSYSLDAVTTATKR